MVWEERVVFEYGVYGVEWGCVWWVDRVWVLGIVVDEVWGG